MTVVMILRRLLTMWQTVHGADIVAKQHGNLVVPKIVTFAVKDHFYHIHDRQIGIQRRIQKNQMKLLGVRQRKHGFFVTIVAMILRRSLQVSIMAVGADIVRQNGKNVKKKIVIFVLKNLSRQILKLNSGTQQRMDKKFEILFEMWKSKLFLKWKIN